MAKLLDPRAVPISEAELLASLRVADDAVLIGGQALAFWLAYFDLPIPPKPTPDLTLAVSNDADFLGMHRHVAKFAQALRANAEYPSDRQLSELHGAVVKQTPQGPRILVDVLRSVVGIPADDVHKRAIPVSHPADESIKFSVMNPVDCLISRLENLRQLEDKRNDVGIWQAEISIQVCRSYLQRLSREGDEPAAIKLAGLVLQLAGSAPGLQAFRKYQLEPLDAIPAEDFATEAFRTKQFAKMAARIRRLRDAYRPPPVRARKR